MYSNIGEVKFFSVIVNEASYANKSVAAGVWNISAKIENANGTDIITWEWYVNSTST